MRLDEVEMVKEISLEVSVVVLSGRGSSYGVNMVKEY